MTSPSSTEDAARESRFFRGWASLALRFRWLLLLGSLAATAFMAVRIATDLKIENSVCRVYQDQMTPFL
jgi:hypothetical protein